MRFSIYKFDVLWYNRIEGDEVMINFFKNQDINDTYVLTGDMLGIDSIKKVKVKVKNGHTIGGLLEFHIYGYATNPWRNSFTLYGKNCFVVSHYFSNIIFLKRFDLNEAVRNLVKVDRLKIEAKKDLFSNEKFIEFCFNTLNDLVQKIKKEKTFERGL